MVTGEATKLVREGTLLRQWDEGEVLDLWIGPEDFNVLGIDPEYAALEGKRVRVTVEVLDGD